MGLPKLGRPIVPMTGALLTLLAWFVVAPTTARADCSHYAASKFERRGEADRFELIDLAASTTPDPSVPATPKPCSGPSCSGQQPGPTAPTVGPVRVLDNWACLAPCPEVPRPGSAPLPLGDRRPGPRDSGLAIFHPPRPVIA